MLGVLVSWGYIHIYTNQAIDAYEDCRQRYNALIGVEPGGDYVPYKPFDVGVNWNDSGLRKIEPLNLTD